MVLSVHLIVTFGDQKEKQMPRNGYWIECIPLSGEDQQTGKSGYKASSASFPELIATAASPDQAIEGLREHLRAVRQHYLQSGKLLPEMDNPVRPPTRWRNVQGWISVYVALTPGQPHDGEPPSGPELRHRGNSQ